MKNQKLTLFFILFCACATTASKWSDAKDPYPGSPEIFGTYGAGCLKGATSLTPDGVGYQVINLQRNRFWGHPSLIDFIEKFGQKMSRAKLGPLMVGDLSAPRGGPMIDGHASHQVGLDVDILYGYPSDAGHRSLTLGERTRVIAPEVVRGLDDEDWSQRIPELLKLASQDDRVVRIFVNYKIKKELCQKFPSEPFHMKVRPWWGHSEHFHTRLLCPQGEAKCENQEPVKDNGCGADLDWWFSDEAKEELKKYQDRKGTEPKLPSECAALIPSL